MSRANTSVLRVLFETGSVVLFLICAYQIGSAKFSAAADDLPRPLPRSSPHPTVSPRPTPPRPLPVINPMQPMWLGQGEVIESEGEYACRVICEANWRHKTLEVIQVTRGAEAWVSLGGFATACSNSSEDRGLWSLTAGRWSTPADSPEQSLCFMVISETRQ